MSAQAGDGVPKDIVEAYKWLHLAVDEANGAERRLYITDRDAIGTNMTSEQLADAQKRARLAGPAQVDSTVHAAGPA